MSDFVNMTDREADYWQDFVDGKSLAKYGPDKVIKKWDLSGEEVYYNFTLKPASR